MQRLGKRSLGVVGVGPGAKTGPVKGPRGGRSAGRAWGVDAQAGAVQDAVEGAVDEGGAAGEGSCGEEEVVWQRAWWWMVE